MFIKSILAATVLASGLALGTAGAAKADSSISFGIGIDSGPVDFSYSESTYAPRHHWGFAGDRWDGGWDRGWDGGWDGGWRYRHRFEDRISCGDGAAVARARGFRGVRPTDCSAPVYEYRGWKYGQPFDIQVSMRGRLLGASPSAW